jgi:hypothetical protein
MTTTPRRILVAVIVVLASAFPAVAQSEPVTISSPSGATLEFSEGATGWRVSRLLSPSSPEGGWILSEEGVELATLERQQVLNRGWTLVEKLSDKVVLEQDSTDTGLRARRVFSFGTAVNTLRMETWVQSPEADQVLARIGLLDVKVEGESFQETGTAPASFPLFGQTLFAGVEHVSAESTVASADPSRIHLQQRPRATIGAAWKLIATAVVGWPQPGVGTGLTGEAGLREAFLHYLDTVRIKPDRIVLHTDTWWTVPLPMTEAGVLGNIETLNTAFQKRTGMFFDTYCIDLGWSNPRSFWAMETRQLPRDLTAVNNRLNELGSRMGLWMSPGSGYPEALNNEWLQSQGYEMTPFGVGLGQVPCFALGGRYQREFKERLLDYTRKYELGHVILDFMSRHCDVAAHGHPVGPESLYAIDAGLADVLDGLRAVKPGILIEPMVCGYPPSPWWLMKTPFVLGPVGDDLPYGRGPCPDWLESLITARDIAYRAGQAAWIMPTQALETFDIIVLSPGEFQNTAVMAIGRGRWFLSTYFESKLMKPEDWDFLAALVRWARQNQSLLGNAWQIGGQPENGDAYGYMFRNPTVDLYCVRNPGIEERTIELPGSLLATEPHDVRMLYPRRATVGRIEPGQRGLAITLAPYETAFFVTAPAGESTPLPPTAAPLRATVTADPPSLLRSRVISSIEEDPSRIRYHWEGTLNVPPVGAPELCVLVEGSPEVSRAICDLVVGGRMAEVQKLTSVGQFGAATDPSPDNWTWFIVPLSPGDTTFKIDLSLWMEKAAISVYLRGTTPAANDPAPETGAVFPTFRADRRGWSQTLQPRQIYEPSSP